MRWLLLSLLLLWAPGAGRAQSPAMALLPRAAAPAQADPPLTPAETKTVLDLLNDPQKRAQFTATLETLLKAGRAVAPKPATTSPLAPDSVGAQVIAKSAGWFSDLTGQVTALGQMRGNLPTLWATLNRMWADRDERADMLDAAWHLAQVVLVAALLQAASRLALRRPVAALAARAAAGSPPVPVPGEGPEPDAPDPTEAERRHARIARTWRALHRVPFVLARLVLGLVPIGLFLALAWLGLRLWQPNSEDVLWVAISAYAGATILIVLVRTLVSPDYASLRVLMLPGDGPGFTLRWARRLILVAALGYAISGISAIYDMPDPARLALMKTVALVDHVFLVVLVLQCRRPVARALRGKGRRNGWGQSALERFASVWHLVAIFFIVGLWLVWAAQLHNGYTRMWRVFVVTAGTLVAARLLALLLLGGLDRLFAALPRIAKRFPGLEQRAGHYYPVARLVLSTLVWIVAGLALLEAWGVDSWAWFRGRALGGQLANAAANMLVALLLCVVVWETILLFLERNLDRHTRQAELARAARLRTLMPIVRTLLALVLITIFGLSALSQIGVNVAPLLAGAGIIGVAIGFGSQKLVQDFITGIFLLIENAMQVGDNVTVAGLAGVVENISIRTLRLRASDGSVHIIPFSAVSTVTNVNRGIGNAAVNVSVALEEDSDHVCSVLAEIATAMRGEPRFGEMMRSDLQLWGVDRMDAGGLTIVGQIVCTDSGRWAVQREFNRRVAQRFKIAGISVAMPAQKLFVQPQGPGPAPAREPQE